MISRPSTGSNPAPYSAFFIAMARSIADTQFVGRAAELGRLHAAFDSARAGDPVTLCIGGEAGVGKTRLVTRFAEQVKEARRAGTPWAAASTSARARCRTGL